MNILPFILALLLTLTLLTVQKIEIFKNQSTVQHHYQDFFKAEGNVILDNFQKKQMDEKTERKTDQVNLKIFVDKADHANTSAEMLVAQRFFVIELMKNLYGATNFYKEMEEKRPEFLKEILAEIEKTSGDDEVKIKCKEDLMKIKIQDPQLRHVFYLMLKGTGTREFIKNIREKSLNDHKKLSLRLTEKLYPSLLSYIRYAAGDIDINKCPRETLQAIFGSSEIVEQVIARRYELGQLKANDPEKILFITEFKDKVRPELKNLPFNFNLPKYKADFSIYD
jgi:hypothetical protein